MGLCQVLPYLVGNFVLLLIACISESMDFLLFVNWAWGFFMALLLLTKPINEMYIKIQVMNIELYFWYLLLSLLTLCLSEKNLLNNYLKVYNYVDFSYFCITFMQLHFKYMKKVSTPTILGCIILWIISFWSLLQFQTYLVIIRVVWPFEYFSCKYVYFCKLWMRLIILYA